MALQVRRVVTGHEANGRVTVKVDEIAKNLVLVRGTPDNRLAILVARGNEGTPAKAEDPGEGGRSLRFPQPPALGPPDQSRNTLALAPAFDPRPALSVGPIPG
jgi:hypothetical protein